MAGNLELTGNSRISPEMRKLRELLNKRNVTNEVPKVMPRGIDIRGKNGAADCSCDNCQCLNCVCDCTCNNCMYPIK